MAGAVLGVVIYLTTPPVYQSTAQVLVIKKRAESLQGTDVRVGVVEDYVATQVTLIRSENIRRAAARQLRGVRLNHPLPDDELATAGVIGEGLTVSRDKEAAATQVGSGVLMLAYRGSDPQDTRRILEAVIKAYQDELSAVYDRATEVRLEALDKTIESVQGERKKASEDRLQRLNELRAITTEDVTSLRARVTGLKKDLYTVQQELTDVTDQLQLIKDAGPNRTKRLAVYYQLNTSPRPGAVSGLTGPVVTGPEAALRDLEIQKANLSRTLGKDNDRIRAIDDQMERVRAEIRRQNPEESDELDELAALELRLKQRKRTAERQQADTQRQINLDEGHLKAASGIQDRIESLTDKLQQFDKDLTRYESERLTTQTTQTSGGYSAQPITPPNVGRRIAPVLLQSLAIGLVVGLLLGGVAAAVAELTDRSFRSPADIRRRLGVPVLGHVPQIRTGTPADAATPGGLQPTLVAALRPKSTEAEVYRGLRTQLYFSTHGRGHQVVQVTSPNPGDGKSTLAANLAVSVAQSGKRVVLIDADFRKPRVHKLFGKPGGEVGLSGVVAGSAPLAAGLTPSGIPNLDLMVCGPRPANPAELLTSPRFQELLEDLKRAYDIVIVDTPPLLAVSDPAAVAPRVDGVLLVFRMSKKARPAAERAREQLAALGANVLGVVVNGSAMGGGRGYGYGYGYGYNYGYNYGYKYAEYEYADEYADEPVPSDARPLPAKG